ncbi:ribonuclease R [Conchiformibius steedae DSM 2580]|uniref:Ribonuclease R n=1 Tax=Conchiformibius steedae DSM 2580 TaxID=1121352 RepID=A0AAE9HUC8_9NEIS|nr:ribonuclease R [Conchiformibius steedae]QMT33140.1 ribonuclease R [Conchiformibius steedae]URD67774.1 ribonuclease R [Conchiformibius steedae DSM 2580]
MKSKKKTNTLNLREKDPYLTREQQKYDAPLPSREWILQLLEEAGVPQKTTALADKLSITAEELPFFERRLKAMARDGQVLINRRGLVCVADKIELVKCRVEAHKDGFGFAVPLTPTGEGDFVLYERQMRGLMHGDIVTVRPAGRDRRGRREGQVLDVVERAQKEVVGRFLVERGVAVLEPEDQRLQQSIILTPDSVAAYRPQKGQVVVAQIDSYPEGHRPAVAQIIEVLGDYADSGMEIEIALRKHRLPHRFSADCEQAAAKIPAKVRPSDRKGREDLHDLPLVTIDGESSRDFDDAVFAEKIGRNYRLVVAIADVSHYVRTGDAIDRDALERATSVYFPRRVIPMLPENLSNGICSLNPDVERLCMVCDMVLTYAGNVKEYRFYPAVMRSHARLTYTQVWNWLSEKAGDGDIIKPEFSNSLNTLYKLFQILQKKRRTRGAMEFERAETEMLFNQQGKIERIQAVTRNDAHKLIEECMLAANVCAADFLLKNKHPALFRNHAGPTPEKLATLREQLGLLGLSLGGGDDPQPKHYAELSAQISSRPDREMIEIMLLRSMQQAVYAPENEGHFGLAYEHYAHFTSPIRRYPDLLVHRAIKAVLAGKQHHVAPHTWAELGTHTSMCERRADDASRDVESWLKTYYMLDKIGEVFGGKVSGVASFGIFVTLDDVHVEGSVHVSDLGEDYFHFRPEIMAMVGERSGVRFGMGDRVTVQVARADLESSRIELVLHHETRPKRGKKSAKPTETAPVATAPRSKKVKAANKTDIQSCTSKSLKMVNGKITRVCDDRPTTAKTRSKRRKK